MGVVANFKICVKVWSDWTPCEEGLLAVAPPPEGI